MAGLYLVATMKLPTLLKSGSSAHKKAIGKAVGETLKRVGTGMRLEAVEIVKETYNVQTSIAKRALKLKRLGGRSLQAQTVRLTITESKLPLKGFAPRTRTLRKYQKIRGRKKVIRVYNNAVSVKIRAKGKRQLIEHAFRIPGASHKQVLSTQKAIPSLSKPVTALASISVHDVLSKKNSRDRIAKRGLDAFNTNINGQLTYFLSKV